MYKELNKIYDQNQLQFFAMAVTHLLDIGFREAKEIKDEDIAKIEDQGWATAGFLQELVATSKEIALACNSPTELIMFCTVKNIFDIQYYGTEKPRIRFDRMTEIADHAIWALHENGNDWNQELEDAELDLDDDEKEFFGIPVEDYDDEEEDAE